MLRSGHQKEAQEKKHSEQMARAQEAVEEAHERGKQKADFQLNTALGDALEAQVTEEYAHALLPLPPSPLSEAVCTCLGSAQWRMK